MKNRITPIRLSLRLFPSLIAALFVSLLAAADARSGVIFHEGFDDNSREWYLKDNEDVFLKVKGGSYIFEHKRGEKSWWTWQGVSDFTGEVDFDVETLITKLDGADDTGYGLTWGLDGARTNYRFLVSGNGSYKVSKEEDGSISEIIDWKENDAVSKYNAGNRLKVSRRGGVTSFYVNGRLVNSLSEPLPFFGDGVGFAIFRDVKVAVDYITVTTFAATSTTTTTTTTYNDKSDVHVVFEDDFDDNSKDWAIDDNEKVRSRIEGGRLLIDHKRTERAWVWSKHVEALTGDEDFLIEGAVEKLDGVNDHGYGLNWGREDGSNNYNFVVYGDGKYKVYKFDDGDYSNVVEKKSHDAVKKGNARNTLKVEKSGARTLFYINGVVVGEVSEALPFFGDRIGFVLNNRMDVGADYIRVTVLSEPAVDAGLSTGKGERFVFEDHFNDKSGGWDIDDDEYARNEIKGGHYSLELKSEDTAWVWYQDFPSVSGDADFEIEAAITRLWGDESYGYGLNWGRDDGSNNYNFKVSPDGFFKVVKLEKGEFVTYIDWTEHDAVRPGGEENRLRVEKRGSVTSFYVNGVKVDEIREAMPFFGDGIGFLADTKMALEIDYIRISGYPGVAKKGSGKKKEKEKMPERPGSGMGVILEEHFNDKSGDWYEGDSEKARSAIRDGRMNLELKAEDTAWVWFERYPAFTGETDFEIETAVTRLWGDGNFGYGLNWGREDGSNNYNYMISANGFYKVSKFEGGDLHDYIEWTEHDAIRPGGEENNLRIESRGGVTRFYVNGVKVDEISEAMPFFGNGVGIIANTKMELDVDYIKISGRTAEEERKYIVTEKEPDLGTVLETEEPVKAPSLTYTVSARDTNGDGIFEGGETVHLSVAVTNVGEGHAEGVKVFLSGHMSLVMVFGEARTLGSIAPGATVVAEFSGVVPTEVKAGNAKVKVSVKEGRGYSPLRIKSVQVGLKPGELIEEETVVLSSLVDVDLIPKNKSGYKCEDCFAVVIGISKYRRGDVIPEIKYARRDAETMARYLETVGGVPKRNIKLLLDDEALKSDIEAVIKEWLPRRVKAHSKVFVYYAGHGSPDPKTKEAYLVPYEGEAGYLTKLYSLKELYGSLNELPAKEVFVMLDSCFSGAGGRSVVAKNTRPMNISIENPVLAGGKVTVLAAAQGNELSSDFDKVKHGLFTYYLLKGMGGDADKNGDGTVGVGEIFSYVSANVADTAATELNRDQTPVLIPGPEHLKDGGFAITKVK